MTVDFAHWPYPARAAHRGGGALAPENTIAALRTGAAFGYRMAEVDVKLSADGVPVLMHDDTVDRTTDGSGRVAAMTLHELQRLDAGRWHSPDCAGERIPTLAGVAAFLLAAGVCANLEIKPCAGREGETGAVAAREARLLWRQAGVPPLLSSFSEAALGAARLAAPELPRALLLDALAGDWIARCHALECVAVVVNQGALTPEAVAHARQAGLRVATYTVNDPQRAGELAAWGVDCIITDAIDRIAPS